VTDVTDSAQISSWNQPVLRITIGIESNRELT